MTDKRVRILIFPAVEVLDFCGPYEAFPVTCLDGERRREKSSPFVVLLVAERAEPVVATGGLRVIPDVTLETCPPLDILVVPGGWGTHKEISNQRLLTWLAERAKQVETLTSVCTGAMLLGQAGLLDGRRVTTHWRSLDRMHQSFPAVTGGRHASRRGGRRCGDVDRDLGRDRHGAAVVARCCGEAVGRATARHMEYPFPDDNRRSV